MSVEPVHSALPPYTEAAEPVAVRALVLREEPYCQIRGPKCRGVAKTVDHIVPLSLRPDLAHVRSNLRSACGPCQFAGGARITNAKRNGYVVPQPRPCGWYATEQLCSRACDVFPLPPGCLRITARRL